MVSREIRELRCNDVLHNFMRSNKGCVFFTLTTADVVDFDEIRRRWRGLRHWLSRRLDDVEIVNLENGKRKRVIKWQSHFVMNFELHPKGHGWHIHTVWNRYIDLRKYLSKVRSFGFGRVDVRKVNTQGVADYLTKHALKAYRCKVRLQEGRFGRCRLVNTSRGLPKLSDYFYSSDFLYKFRKSYRSVNRLCLNISQKRSIALLMADMSIDILKAVSLYFGLYSIDSQNSICINAKSFANLQMLKNDN